MDRARVDIQAVSPSPQQFYWAEAMLGARLSRLQNEHVARLVAERPAGSLALVRFRSRIQAPRFRNSAT
jgi:hypothetical protein